MKARLLPTLGFALAWLFLAGGPTFGNALFGAMLGLGLAWLLPPGIGASGGSRFRLVPALKLLLRFPLEVWLSGWRVAKIVLSPELRVRPALLDLPLRLTRDGEVALLANLITLTPGTLTVDSGRDGESLLIHALDVEDLDAAASEIRDGFERMILETWERREARQ